MNWLSYLLAIAAGAANPGQSAANAELKNSLASPLTTAIAVYLSGLVGVLAIQLVLRQAWPGSEKLAQTPWWAWTGGALSIASTLAGISYAQKMGSGVFTGLSVTAALVTSIVLDHFGWLGLKTHPASWPRVLGCGLMIGGLWLIGKF